MKKKFYYINAIVFLSCFCLSSCGDDSPANTGGDDDDDDNGEEYVQDTDYLNDRNLLNTLQKDAFQYIWTSNEPNSGLAPERLPSTGNITIGGSGFGIAAIPVGVERGFITREQGVERMTRMVDFLLKADKYKGAFSHWYKGATGKTVPFSSDDDGGDIVETSFLIEGLLIAREYFNGTGAEEILRNKINQIWEGVNWDWYRNNNNYLLWHWSPNYGFSKNLKITGFNECFVTYILALASPTHSINRIAYDGWTSTTGYQPKSGAGYTMEAASKNYGGPLFFSHYSFVGLDGRKMGDNFVKKGYFVRNINHTMSNRGYCVYEAPAENKYSATDWGLTASYGKDGYAAHDPLNDKGILAPTAALSSMPYTPYYSFQVLRNLYAKKSTLWGNCGPFDAYSLKYDWVSSQGMSDGKPKDYLSIDQLTIVCMVENYRTGLLWKLFMQAPEIQSALTKAGISMPNYETGFYLSVPQVVKSGSDYVIDALDIVRHPDTGKYEIPFFMKNAGEVTFTFRNSGGKTVKTLTLQAKAGENILQFEKEKDMNSGKFTVSMAAEGKIANMNVRLN